MEFTLTMNTSHLVPCILLYLTKSVVGLLSPNSYALRVSSLIFRHVSYDLTSVLTPLSFNKEKVNTKIK